jgi:hypothetical protein
MKRIGEAQMARMGAGLLALGQKAQEPQTQVHTPQYIL